MKGKLVIEVKVPDGAVIFDPVYVSQVGGLFEVKLGPGSTYIENIGEEMKIYAHLGTNKCGKTEIIKINPEKFHHIIIDYDYYYYRNHPRIGKVRWQEVEHITQDQLYCR